jgi:TIR domain-containing protein
MPGKIFVNYRRDDARDMAARIRDRLAATFGASNVFMDVDNLLAGQRFDRELEKALGQTDVFLAVIGPRWPELSTSCGNRVLLAHRCWTIVMLDRIYRTWTQSCQDWACHGRGRRAGCPPIPGTALRSSGLATFAAALRRIARTPSGA